MQLRGFSNSAEGYPLEVSRVAVVGAGRDDFLVSSENCTAGSVPSAGTCQVRVRFGPTAIGSRNATLQITYNSAASPFTVPLSGSGVALPTGPTKAKKGKAATWKVNINNSGNSSVTGVRLKASGKGVNSSKSVEPVAALATKGVNIEHEFPTPGGRVRIVLWKGPAESCDRRLCVLRGRATPGW